MVDVRRRRTRDASSPVPHLAAVGLEHPYPVEDPEGRQRVDRLLGHLALRQRNIVVLRVLLGLSARETATALGMSSAGAVRVSRHRALVTLRRHVDGPSHL